MEEGAGGVWPRSPLNSAVTCWSASTDDRYGQRSTLVTSQMPVDNWHELIGDPTLADAILDRLVHNAYRINIKGESMRKQTKKLTTPGTSD